MCPLIRLLTCAVYAVCHVFCSVWNVAFSSWTERGSRLPWSSLSYKFFFFSGSGGFWRYWRTYSEIKASNPEQARDFDSFMQFRSTIIEWCPACHEIPGWWCFNGWGHWPRRISLKLSCRDWFPVRSAIFLGLSGIPKIRPKVEFRKQGVLNCHVAIVETLPCSNSLVHTIFYVSYVFIIYDKMIWLRYTDVHGYTH